MTKESCCRIHISKGASYLSCDLSRVVRTLHKGHEVIHTRCNVLDSLSQLLQEAVNMAVMQACVNQQVYSCAMNISTNNAKTYPTLERALLIGK